MNKGIYTNALPNCTVKTIVIRHGNVTVVQAIGGGVHRTTKQPVDCNANGNHAKGNVPKSTKGGALNDLSAENKLWNVLISILTIFLIIGWIVVVVFMGMVIPPFLVHVQERSRQWYSVKKIVRKVRAKFPSGQFSAGADKVQRAVYGTLRQHLYVFLALVQFTFVDPVEGVFTPGDRTALKAAKVTCLSETPVDGSCPNFAAQNGNGAIGDWDVSKVTDMDRSTFATTN